MPLLHRDRRIVRRHRELWILIDEFDPSEMPLLLIGIPFLIDPLGDRPKQVVSSRYSDRISLMTIYKHKDPVVETNR